MFENGYENYFRETVKKCSFVFMCVAKMLGNIFFEIVSNNMQNYHFFEINFSIFISNTIIMFFSNYHEKYFIFA